MESSAMMPFASLSPKLEHLEALSPGQVEQFLSLYAQLIARKGIPDERFDQFGRGAVDLLQLDRIYHSHPRENVSEAYDHWQRRHLLEVVAWTLLRSNDDIRNLEEACKNTDILCQQVFRKLKVFLWDLERPKRLKASKLFKLTVTAMRMISEQLHGIGVREASAIVAAWTPHCIYMSDELLQCLLDEQERQEVGDDWELYEKFYWRATKVVERSNMTSDELDRVVWTMHYTAMCFGRPGIGKGRSLTKQSEAAPASAPLTPPTLKSPPPSLTTSASSSFLQSLVKTAASVPSPEDLSSESIASYLSLYPQLFAEVLSPTEHILSLDDFYYTFPFGQACRGASKVSFSAYTMLLRYALFRQPHAKRNSRLPSKHVVNQFFKRALGGLPAKPRANVTPEKALSAVQHVMNSLSGSLRFCKLRTATAVVAALTPMGIYMSDELYELVMGHKPIFKTVKWDEYRDFYLEAVEVLRVLHDKGIRNGRMLEKLAFCVYHAHKRPQATKKETYCAEPEEEPNMVKEEKSIQEFLCDMLARDKSDDHEEEEDKLGIRSLLPSRLLAFDGRPPLYQAPHKRSVDQQTDVAELSSQTKRQKKDAKKRQFQQPVWPIEELEALFDMSKKQEIDDDEVMEDDLQYALDEARRNPGQGSAKEIYLSRLAEIKRNTAKGGNLVKALKYQDLSKEARQRLRRQERKEKKKLKEALHT